MPCDMCGNKGELAKADVEGVIMELCNNCKKYGEVLRQPRNFVSHNHNKKRNSEPEIKKMVVNNYSEIIRKKREQLGLKQKEFAMFLKEKESTIHNLESGKLSPSLDLASKLEKKLNIKLIEDYEKKEIKTEKVKSGPLTIGDMIKDKFNIK